MRKKESPALTGLSRSGSFQSTRTVNPRQCSDVPESAESVNAEESRFRVEIYKEGLALVAPGTGFGTMNLKRGEKRGKIGGWSRRSRQRMREYLITHAPADGDQIYSATLTIPGPPLPVEIVKTLWHNFSHRIKRRKAGCIWRLEVQRRGSMHWHCLIVTKGTGQAGEIVAAWHEAVAGLSPVRWWLMSYDPEESAGPLPAGQVRVLTKAAPDETLHGVAKEKWAYDLVYSDTKPDGAMVQYWNGPNEASTDNLMDWLGAKKHAAEVESCPEGASSAKWKRYLQDHASKGKAEQVAEGFGRHWGVIGRARFTECGPVEVHPMEEKRYARLVRAYTRLCTPYMKDPKAMFGRRRGYHVKRGRIGRSVYFSRPETIRRLVLWASGSESDTTPTAHRIEAERQAGRPLSRS